MAAPPDADPPISGAPHPEMEDRPPFLTWRKIYLLVIATLALEVVVFTLLSRAVQ